MNGETVRNRWSKPEELHMGHRKLLCYGHTPDDLTKGGNEIIKKKKKKWFWTTRSKEGKIEPTINDIRFREIARFGSCNRQFGNAFCFASQGVEYLKITSQFTTLIIPRLILIRFGLSPFMLITCK